MTEFGRLPPGVSVPPPGPASRRLAARLRRVESRNVTWLGDDFPIFWEEARGANVRDADGNVYLDLTAAFGVALLGHRDAGVAEALRVQGGRLVHGMGDVHPPGSKVVFLEGLVDLLENAGFHPREGCRALLASSGSEAVEAALKTSHLATGRPGVVAFRGGYHGLTLGALSTTARAYFRMPFRQRLREEQVAWGTFPVSADSLEESLHEVEVWLADGLPGGVPVGTVIVEPVQARGGVRIPTPGFGERLTSLARKHGVVLVADEIYTGLGRCGSVLASQRVGLDPDLVCLGKVLGGGLPMSACVGSTSVMDAWPASPGEALHTSTFLGHPLACAAGSAVLARVAGGLPQAAEELGGRLRTALVGALGSLGGVREVRGMGLLLGIELEAGGGVKVAKEALRQGLLVLPAGDQGEVVELSPPATLTRQQERAAVEGLVRSIGTVLGSG